MCPSQLFTWRRELRKQMQAQGLALPAIVFRFGREHRLAINDKPLSANSFSAEILLIPDGDPVLSRKYGEMRLTLTGDSQKMPNVTQSEMDQWLKDAIVDLLTSKGDVEIVG